MSSDPARREEAPLLELDGLEVSFPATDGPRKALQGIDLAVTEGEIVGLVGETGAGKSILARSIIGLLPGNGWISAGDIRYRGNSVVEMPYAERRRFRGGEVGLIGTNPKSLLNPVETVGRQIGRVLRAHRAAGAKEAELRVRALLDELGIVDPDHMAKSYPHELSGGMAQRAVIGMAMIAEPTLLLADDATLGLDATIQLQVLDLLVTQCRKRGMAILLITHDLGIIARYCDRVVIMRGGRLLEESAVNRFLGRPGHSYSQDLLAAAKAKPTLSRPTARDQRDDKRFIRVDGLVKHFTSRDGQSVVRAVDGVSFHIDRGETLVLVGESGSGKTTVGQCLLHLLPPTSGTIHIDGEEFTSLSGPALRMARRRVQMVFQEPYTALNSRWRVRELVSEPFRLLPTMTKGERSERIDALLDLVGLDRRLVDALPRELTAGEQKRVGIARALATEPDFVVFDEPTTALDIRIRSQIIDLIRDLQIRTGQTALFITHDLNSVRSLAHRVAVMNLGLIVEHGDTETIFNEPKEEYTRTLLRAELPIETSSRADDTFAAAK